VRQWKLSSFAEKTLIVGCPGTFPADESRLIDYMGQIVEFFLDLFFFPFAQRSGHALFLHNALPD
jgi:hypothetical protein